MNNFVIINDQTNIEVNCIEAYEVEGLVINFNGFNNTVFINKPYNFSNSKIEIVSNNSIVDIGASSRPVSFDIFIHSGDYQTVKIGKEFSCGSMSVLMTESFSFLNIGNDCMLSSDIFFMVGDSHQIYKNNTKKIKNWGSGITIGNHVWIGKFAKLVSGAKVSHNSIVAFNSLVAKTFDMDNITIGGSPAQILSENVSWERPSLEVLHNRKMNFYGIYDLSLPDNELKDILVEEIDESWKNKVIKGYKKSKNEIYEYINILKSTKEYKEYNPVVFNFICSKLLEVGDYQQILRQISIFKKYSELDSALMIIVVKVFLNIDREKEAKEYLIKLLNSEDYSSYLLDILVLCKDYNNIWDNHLLSKKIIYNEIFPYPDRVRAYFYLLLSLGEGYEVEVLPVAEKYLTYNLDLKFFVDCVDILIKNKAYNKTIYYINKLLDKHKNSIWLFKKLMYIYELTKDIKNFERTYKQLVYYNGFNSKMYRYFIDFLLAVDEPDIASRYLNEMLVEGFDKEWSSKKLASI